LESIGRYSAAVYRLTQSIFNYKLKELEISSGQYDFLLVIAKNEGMSQKDLGEMLYVEKSSTAKAVRKLLDKGYIFKEQAENDKRYDALYLTEKGRAAAVLVKDAFAEMIEVLSKGIPDEQIKQTVEVLKKVIGNLQTEKSRSAVE
jgi:DNA-binding MarR family transcriptional regulator